MSLSVGSSAATASAHAMIVRLRPTGPWRIGPDSGDRDRVDRVYHSDSLYSAITHAMARLGVLEEWLDETARASESAVRFSSCFPFLGETLYVIPPSHVWPPPPSSKVRWKGAKFVPLKVVDMLLAGHPLKEDGWMVDVASECLLPSASPAGAAVFRTSVRSNAAMDRGGGGALPHSTACLEFAPHAGLWFAAAFSGDTAKERWGDRLRGALRLLADSGFGGGRSRGWGRSEMPEIVEGPLTGLLLKSTETGSESGHWMLSLFHPAESDSVDWTRGHYAVTSRGGRIESTSQWGAEKSLARMVTEGSVLVAANNLHGSAPNVAPEGFEHPVYRAGFALALRVPLKPVTVVAAPPVTGPEVIAAESLIEQVSVPVVDPVNS